MPWYDPNQIADWKRAASRRTIAESEAEIERLMRVERAKHVTVTHAAASAEAMEADDN